MIASTRWTVPEQQRDTLPDDLRDWIPANRMAEWIEEDIGKLNWEDAETRYVLADGVDARLKRLLAILTYAHAAGHTNSESILEECSVEPRLSRLCEGQTPTLRDLVAFRRKNPEVLEAMLTELFKRAVKEKFDCGLLPLAVKKYVYHAASLRVQAGFMADAGLPARSTPVVLR